MTNSPISVKPAYTPAEFCAAFAVGRSAFFREVREGRLRTYKVGTRTLVAGEDAIAWRERYRNAERPAPPRDVDTRQPAAA